MNNAMQAVKVRIGGTDGVGGTIVAFDASTMTALRHGDRRFTINDGEGRFLCSIEVWGPHEVEFDGDGPLTSVNPPAATQSEDCAIAQPEAE